MHNLNFRHASQERKTCTIQTVVHAAFNSVPTLNYNFIALYLRLN